MARIFKNKTQADAAISSSGVTQVIPGGDSFDLEETFKPWQLAASESLIDLLGQGTDKYQLNDGTFDLSVSAALRLIMGLAPSEGPKAVDGIPFMAPCIFPAGMYLYFSSAGDGTERGNGTAFCASSEVVGDTTVEWSFLDLVLMAGGSADFKGGEIGDCASLEVVAPATPVVPNVGNTGNCNVVNGVIVPAAGDGAYDVDLDDAVPVPAQTLTGYNGYWDWTQVLIGKGEVTPSSTPGAAHWHLIAADVTLVRYANRLQLLGDGHLDFTVPAIEPKAMLPHWKGKLTLHNSGHAGLKLSFILMMGRALTVGAAP